MGEKGNILQGASGLSERLEDAASAVRQGGAGGAEPGAGGAARTGAKIAGAVVSGVTAAKLTGQSEDDEDQTAEGSGEAGPPI